MKKTILVTAIGGDIGSTVLKCIRRGYTQARVIGCDIQPYVQGIDYVDEFLLAPPYREKEAYLAFLHRVCEEKQVTHFFPMGEPEILIADEDRAFYEERGIHLLINNHRILEIASSKYKTAEFLRSNGILAPETYYKGACQGQLGYPLIVKADYGCGSKKLWVVHTKEEWDALAALPGEEYVAQEYIGDAAHEYTTGVFSDGVRCKSITYQRTLGYGGMSIRVETVTSAKIEQLAKQLADLLQLKGSINVQMRLTEKGYSIFEINPRISSTAGFRDKMGFHDVIWWLQCMDGESVDFGEQIGAGIVGIKTLDERIFMEGAKAAQK